MLVLQPLACPCTHFSSNDEVWIAPGCLGHDGSSSGHSHARTRSAEASRIRPRSLREQREKVWIAPGCPCCGGSSRASPSA
eukprot:11206016-Alexandrium_andersonii.AAC.1